ncbi:MAG: FHA domain-containing protein, partial [Actinomycetales bacterium]|nr:FHA domain-containing protein [Actinomycetales bacterium]
MSEPHLARHSDEQGARLARHHLAVVDGPDAGWVAPLTGAAPVVIGRAETATLRLGDALLSREHLAVRARRGRVQARDLCSANGTRWRAARRPRARAAPCPSS